MKTIIYLMRHSQPMKNNIHLENNDSLQLTNEKNPLSVVGEDRAKLLAELSELDNIDTVISSNYVRAMGTAKYVADRNNKGLNIIAGFGERKFGIADWSQLTQGFEKKQLIDLDYKIGDGESHREVADRMYDSLMMVLRNNLGKRVAIVSHATAITFLFMKFGNYSDEKLYFKDKVIFDNDFVWNAPELFKLTFEDEVLMDIENIRF